jgi:hypothetical protein
MSKSAMTAFPDPKISGFETRSRMEILATILLPTLFGLGAILPAGCQRAEKSSALGSTEFVPANRLPNPSFETGIDGWTYSDGFTVSGGAKITTEDAFDGKNSLNLTLPDGIESSQRYVGVHSYWLPADSGSTMTLSVYARALDGSPELTLGFNNSNKSETFKVGREWQRYAFTEVLKLRQPSEIVEIRLTSPGAILVDAVQLELGDSTRFGPTDPVEMGFYCDRSPSLACPGEETTIGFDLYAPSVCPAPPRDLKVVWEYGDHENDTLSRESFSYALQPGETIRERMTWKAPEAPGLYHWRAILVSDGRELARRDHSIAVVPPQDSPSESEKMGFFSFCSAPANVRLDAACARYMGVSTLRLIGAFNPFADYSQEEILESALIDYLHERGFGLYVNFGKHGNSKKLLRLFKKPGWRNRFSRFLALIAKRYHGKIQGYEIWNEPSAHVDAKKYVEFHSMCYRALKKGSGEVLVGGPSVMGKSPDWLKETLDAGLGKSLDAITIHGHMRQTPEQGVPQYIVRVMGPQFELLKKHGVGNLPIWDTESGYQIFEEGLPLGAPRWYYKTAREQAMFSVRQHLMMLAGGFDMKSHFIMNSMAMQACSPFRQDALRGARPLAVAYAVMTSELRKARADQMYLDLESRIYAYRFAAEDGERWVIWTPGAPTTLHFPPPLPERVITMYGREGLIKSADDGWNLEVGPEPRYLHVREGGLDLSRAQRKGGRSMNFQPDNAEWHKQSQSAFEDDEVDARRPPVKPSWVLSADDARHVSWYPGVVEAKGARRSQVLALTDKPGGRGGASVVFHFMVDKEEAGQYEIWGACAPVFFKENTKLAYALDGLSAIEVQGTDVPETYEVEYGEGRKVGLVWERFGTVNLSAGTHTLTIGLAAEQKGDPANVYHQFLDEVIFHRTAPRSDSARD